MTCLDCPHLLSIVPPWLIHDAKNRLIENPAPIINRCSHDDLDPMRNDCEGQSDGNEPGPEIEDVYEPPAWCPLRPFTLLTLEEAKANGGEIEL